MSGHCEKCGHTICICEELAERFTHDATCPCYDCLTARLAAAEAALDSVADMIDDVLFDPTFHPRDEYGDEIRGNSKYLIPHPIQEDHMPALREWFVQYCEKKYAPNGGVRVSENLRKRLGRRVREVWIRWAERQPNPKPSWLVPYKELSPAYQDADECIGIAIWAECVDSLQSELGELETLRAERDILDKHLTAVCEGVNRRCGADSKQLPLVSLDRLLAAHARDRINLVAWVLRRMDQFGCFSGDCSHDLNSECIQSIIDEYVAEEAKAGGRV